MTAEGVAFAMDDTEYSRGCFVDLFAHLWPSIFAEPLNLAGFPPYSSSGFQFQVLLFFILGLISNEIFSTGQLCLYCQVVNCMVQSYVCLQVFPEAIEQALRDSRVKGPRSVCALL